MESIVALLLVMFCNVIRAFPHLDGSYPSRGNTTYDRSYIAGTMHSYIQTTSTTTVIPSTLLTLDLHQMTSDVTDGNLFPSEKSTFRVFPTTQLDVSKGIEPSMTPVFELSHISHSLALSGTPPIPSVMSTLMLSDTFISDIHSTSTYIRSHSVVGNTQTGDNSSWMNFSITNPHLNTDHVLATRSLLSSGDYQHNDTFASQIMPSTSVPPAKTSTSQFIGVDYDYVLATIYAEENSTMIVFDDSNKTSINNSEYLYKNVEQLDHASLFYIRLAYCLVS